MSSSQQDREKQAVALLPDKPSEKHTKLITCQGDKAGGEAGCKRKRWVKPQDAFQVKLCTWCRDAKKQSKAKASLKVLKARIEKKAVIATAMRYVPRLYVLKFMRATPLQLLNSSRGVKRIWP